MVKLRFAAPFTAALGIACGIGPGSPDAGPDADSGADAGPDADAGPGDGAGDGGPDVTENALVGLRLDSECAQLRVGEPLHAHALGKYASGDELDVTEIATWESADAGALAVESAGTARGAGPGWTKLSAALGGFHAEMDVRVRRDPTEADEEGRALWVTRFAYADEQDVRGVVRAAANNGFNAVLFQVRGTADAYYHSSLEPWAERLTGTLGQDPGWDPLGAALDEAHKNGIELHAYVNAFTGWPKGGAPAASTPEHVLRTHPEWLAVNSSGVNSDSEYQWLSPGNPAVRDHAALVIEDLATNYAVDGVHLDRIRYPGRDFSYDAESNARFAASGETDRAAWQRAQVNDAVAAFHDALRRARPCAALSAAVIGTYQNASGCHNQEAFSDVYQDAPAWAAAGAIEIVMPMIYWALDPGACTDFGARLADYTSRAAGRQVWAGMHVLTGGAPDFPALYARILHARGHAAGHVLFASSYLDQFAQWDDLVAGPYAEPAETPEVPVP